MNFRAITRAVVLALCLPLAFARAAIIDSHLNVDKKALLKRHDELHRGRLVIRSSDQQIDEPLKPRGNLEMLGKISELIDSPAGASNKMPSAASKGDGDELDLPLWPQSLKKKRNARSLTQLPDQLTVVKPFTTHDRDPLERYPTSSSASRAEEAANRSPPSLLNQPSTSAVLLDQYLPSSLSPKASRSTDELGHEAGKSSLSKKPSRITNVKVASDAKLRQQEATRAAARRAYVRRLIKQGTSANRFEAAEIADAMELRPSGPTSDTSHLSEKELKRRAQKREAQRRRRIRLAGENAVIEDKYTVQQYLDAHQPRSKGFAFFSHLSTIKPETRQEQVQADTRKARDIGISGHALASSHSTSATQPSLEQHPSWSGVENIKPSQGPIETSAAVQPDLLPSTSFKKDRTLQQRYPEKKARAGTSSDAGVTAKAQRQTTDQAENGTTEANSERVMPATNSRGYATVALMAPKPKPRQHFDDDALQPRSEATTSASA